ncbi:MAG: glycosylase [Fuerstiella sp.]|nr:glycosylase [Fuerstiella sp.]MCP4859593.1 glycosylase [Fuerstiella sp.]
MQDQPIKSQILVFVASTWMFICLTATSSAQDLPAAFRAFESAADAPVFTSSPGEWDALIRERGWILKDGEDYRLWYTGYNQDRQPVSMKLGYATSPDGITWTRHPRNPIFDDAWVEDVMIVKHKATLYMFAEGAKDQPQLLKSTDGIAWQRMGALDVRHADGTKIAAGPYGTPTAFFEDGTWYLFYERRDQGIWLATSRDMGVWTNVSDEPLIIPGPGAYDKLMIAMNQVIKYEGRYYAVLHGTGSPAKPRDWCTYMAVSDDLRAWKKCSSGPLLPVQDNKSSGQLVHDDRQFRLYTMHGRVDLHVPSGRAVPSTQKN